MRKDSPMTNFMSRRELICAAAWFLMHLLVLPQVLGGFMLSGKLDETQATYVQYAAGALFMVILCFSWFREGFHRYMDHPFRNLFYIIGSYYAIMMFNSLISIVLWQFMPIGNLNNEAVAGMAVDRPGMTFAMTVLLAPLVEEPLFRGVLFGGLRRKSRAAAYAVSIVFFSLYHVVNYLSYGAIYALYGIIYIPSAFMLCLCYEQSDSIWSSVFLHMLVNGVAISSVLSA